MEQNAGIARAALNNTWADSNILVYAAESASNSCVARKAYLSGVRTFGGRMKARPIGSVAPTGVEPTNS